MNTSSIVVPMLLATDAGSLGAAAGTASVDLSWIAWPVAGLFTVAGLVCTMLLIVGLPGAWLTIALAVVVDLLDGLWLPESDRPTFSIGILVVAVVLAALGELVEFLASALGARRMGASRRGIAGALLGSLVGAVAGTVLLPIPVIGTLAGAIGGSFLGAVLGETSSGRSVEHSMRPATGAAIGRVFGTLGKIPFAMAVWAVLAVAAFLG